MVLFSVSALDLLSSRNAQLNATELLLLRVQDTYLKAFLSRTVNQGQLTWYLHHRYYKVEVRPTMASITQFAVSSEYGCLSACVPIYTNIMLSTEFGLQIVRGDLLEDFIWGNMGDRSGEGLWETRSNCAIWPHCIGVSQMGILDIGKSVQLQ